MLYHYRICSMIIIKIFFFCCILIFIYSCGHDENENGYPVKSKTLLIYIVAGNNLINSAKELLQDLDNYNVITTQTNNIVILFDDGNDTRLYNVTNKGLKCVRQYGCAISVSETFMQKVLYEVNHMFPAQETGLVLWSHGSGWLPTGNTRSFGDDDGEAIDINEIANSIKMKFDYIIFDACYMGCIEVLTELYKSCKYLIASPGIVPVTGIIDKSAINEILKNENIEARLRKICDNYTSKYGNVDPITVFNTSQMDNVISTCRNLRFDNYTIKSESIYVYKFRGYDIFYDLGNLLSIMQVPASFLTDKFIIYTSKSSKDKYIAGLSVFIPTTSNVDYINYYSITKWNLFTDWLSKFNLIQN